jgi:hypothetical protein
MKKLISTAKWDAELNTDVCDRFNNAELTLTLKLHLRQVNPAGGAINGTHHDYGDATEPARKTVKWTSTAWDLWKKKFAKSAEEFWHGKFWLLNNFDSTPKFEHCYDDELVQQCLCHKSLDFMDKRVMYRPNVWCRFKLSLVDSAGAAHHTIDVVRLHPSVSWFGSHATLYDNRDIDYTQKGSDSKKKTLLQRAHVHEVGHLLGLPHVDVGKAHCPTTGNTNAGACYGVADADMHDVMGNGMTRRAWQAKPWRDAMVRITGAGSVSTEGDWKAELQRHYPRTMDEVKANAKITKKPNRG